MNQKPIVRSRAPLRLLAFLAAVLGPAGVCAQAPSASAYPSKPVRLIVGFPPGGGSDALARLVAAALSEKLGQQFLVDNKPGANTIVGTQYVQSQPADGYTLLFVSASFAINPSLYKLTYDIEKDFTPVAVVALVPLLLITNNNVPAKSVKDLVAMARAQPGKLTFASFGAGSAGHLAAEMLLAMTGTEMIHVPY
jgi:tripartite-type tricarboxylate transporter receptor subunit TctC